MVSPNWAHITIIFFFWQKYCLTVGFVKTTTLNSQDNKTFMNMLNTQLICSHLKSFYISDVRFMPSGKTSVL